MESGCICGRVMYLWTCASGAHGMFAHFFGSDWTSQSEYFRRFSRAFFRTGTPAPFVLFRIGTSRLGLFAGLGQSQPCPNPTKVALKRANPGANENKIAPRNKSTEFGIDLVAHKSSGQKPRCHRTPREHYGAVTVSYRGKAQIS